MMVPTPAVSDQKLGHALASHRLKIGLLGAGGINTIVAQSIISGRLPGVTVLAVAGSTATSRSARHLATLLEAAAVAPADLPTAGCTWVIEAAGSNAVRAHAPIHWRARVNTILMSIGALIEPSVYSAWLDARAHGVRVVLPSGAIAGLDGVRAMSAVGGLRRVELITTKAPAGLRGAPYLRQHGIELPNNERTTVFDGTAREAVVGFPANVNVAIALSLAGMGPDATRVQVISDPHTTRTRHLVRAEGAAASIEVCIVAEPNPRNPRTSYLAGAAAVAALREVAESHAIGATHFI